MRSRRLWGSGFEVVSIRFEVLERYIYIYIYIFSIKYYEKPEINYFYLDDSNNFSSRKLFCLCSKYEY